MQGKTVAADTSKLPMGTCVEIEGLGQRVVEDVGSAIKGHRLDVFFGSHAEALEFGRKVLRVRPCSDH